LRALERSRSLALEEAQSLRRGRSQQLTERDREHEAREQERDRAYEMQRNEIVSLGGFSAEKLGMALRYTATVSLQENEAREAREQAQAQLHEAEEQTLRRLEDLKVIERLRERRRLGTRRRQARRAERRLDELGVIRACRDPSNPGTEGE
jgi:hypothetical protein